MSPELLRLAAEYLPEAVVTLLLGIVIVSSLRERRIFMAPKPDPCAGVREQLAALSERMHEEHEHTRDVIRDRTRSEAA